jgi:hypothetical protein
LILHCSPERGRAHKQGIAPVDNICHPSFVVYERRYFSERAAAFLQTLEQRQGLRIACPEEIAYVQRFITHDEFVALPRKHSNNYYGKYLLRVAEEELSR